MRRCSNLAVSTVSSGAYLRPASAPPHDAIISRGVFVDVETTGLDSTVDEILELAMLTFDYSMDGSFVTPAGSFSQMRDPGRPIPPDVTR